MNDDELQDQISDAALKRKSTSTQQALDVIDFEIARIESEQTRPGWTLWAVFGAITSLLWLLSNEYEKGNVQIFNVAQIVLVLSIARDVIHYGARQLAPVRHRHYESSPRFNFATGLESPSGMFFYWIRFAFLFVLSILLAPKVNWSHTVPLLVFYGLFTLLGLIGFASTYYDPLVLTRYVPKSRIANNRRIRSYLVSYTHRNRVERYRSCESYS